MPIKLKNIEKLVKFYKALKARRDEKGKKRKAQYTVERK